MSTLLTTYTPYATHCDMDLAVIQDLGDVSLAIPAWQMAAFIAIVSVFLLLRRLQLCLLVNYIFVLYWGFILYSPSFVSAAGGNTIALTVYVLSGLAIAGLAIISFFQQSN